MKFVCFVFFLTINCSVALYNADIDIGIYTLTWENFNATLYRHVANHIQRRDPLTEDLTWVVQFYNSWCGHCIKFSPSYKALAKKVQYWKDVIRIGTVDCSYSHNRPLCTRFDITATPAVRVFPPFSNSSFAGEPLELERTVTGMVHQMLDLLEFQSHRQELHSLPDMPIQEIWAGFPPDVETLAIIVEPLGSYIGKESIMHLQPNLHIMTVRRTVNINQVLLTSVHSLGRQTPYIVFLQRNLLDQQGIVDLNTLREAEPVRAFCEAILRADTELTTRRQISRRPHLGPVYEQTEPDVSRHKIMVSDEQRQRPPPAKADLNDVNAALTYAISHEVASREAVEGKELGALKSFVQAVLKHIPARADILMALRQLDTALLRRSSIQGQEILQVLRESGLDFEEDRIRWTHCQGSVAHLRGYPCALWTTFHMLSVRAYETDPPTQNAIGPDGVLTAAIGYIEHLFSCEDCSRHFVQYADSIRRYKVKHMSNADAVLFLWRAHNSANRRLAGDLSEDPAYPKVQWPTASECPRCRTTSQSLAMDVWNEQEVLKFLQKFYGKTPGDVNFT